MKIQRVHAREVLDSRGQPTVEVEVTLKNGRKAAQGQCPVCGTKVMRILGKSAS